MNINGDYPQKISWRIDISDYDNYLAPFGGKTRKKIHKAEQHLAENNYNIKVDDVNEEFIDNFIKIYTRHIQSIGGQVHDVKYKIITKPPHSYPYKAVSVYKGNQYIGGLLFSDRGDHLVTAYKAIPRDTGIKLPIGMSYLVEAELYKYALTHNKQYIRRGRDRNLYGIELAIGIALYKLQIGNYPILVPDKKLTIIDSFDWKGQDVLVFLAPQAGNKIDKAIMYSTKSVDELHTAFHLLFTNKYVTVDITNMSSTKREVKLSEYVLSHIKQARKDAGLSQRDLGKAIKVSDKTVSAWEVGRAEPSLNTLEEIAEALNKPVVYFVKDEDYSTASKLVAIQKELQKVEKLMGSDK
ncbi:helix-turn-helix transcriptional regulator [Candidatus Microgenomates bacterium]|nr:helix-turn-helix transcriptional regulator [Candidatus Microgenomates bacterium]